MKVGILSMQKVINYGSFLQAYALKKIIQSLGHSVSFVDIIPGSEIPLLHSKSKRKYFVDKYIIKRVEHVIFSKMRKARFKNNYFEVAGINHSVPENQCDIIVIGSDEVFNCCQPAKWGFSHQLLGATECSSISYAGSFGYSDYDKICSMSLAVEASHALNHLRAISVRDENSVSCIRKLIGKNPEQHLDPVLIYEWSNEVIPQDKYKDYILIYSYDNRINDENEIRVIKKFAKKHRKKIISFGLYQRWCDKNISCSPFELLSYFDSADYVITDTFHGTVFSIKRNKKFATIIRDSNYNKLSDLMKKMGVWNRRVENLDDLEKVLQKDIPYESINLLISKERERAIMYLRENLR